MGRSPKYGVGAVIRFNIGSINERRSSAHIAREWQASTGVSPSLWGTAKWRGKLAGRREGRSGNRGQQTFFYIFHPEKTPPPGGNTRVTDEDRNAERWDTNVRLEVKHSACSLCRGGEAPISNQTWFPTRASGGRGRGRGRWSLAASPDYDVANASVGACVVAQDVDGVPAAAAAAPAPVPARVPSPAPAPAPNAAPAATRVEFANIHNDDLEDFLDENESESDDGAVSARLLAPAGGAGGACGGNSNNQPAHSADDEYARLDEVVDVAMTAPLDDDSTAFTEGGVPDVDGMRWGPIRINDRDYVIDERQAALDALDEQIQFEPMLRLPRGQDVASLTPYDMFLEWLPISWIRRRLLPSMTARLAAADERPHRFALPDVLELLGVLMYYGRVMGEKFTDLWAQRCDTVFRQVPHPMSRHGVSRERVQRTMRFFDCLMPEEIDRDNPVKGLMEMVAAFNAHWRAKFRPGEVNCLDESCVKSTSSRDYLRVRASFLIMCSMIAIWRVFYDPS